MSVQGTKLSVNDFVLKAVASALAEVPSANCLWDAGAGDRAAAPAIDVSVAVATDRGLITPIVRAANTKSVAQVAERGRGREGQWVLRVCVCAGGGGGCN
jgi:pyruvate dehydrogenase E2 component (dihydrolipoamide acetyltransferase)